MLIGWDLVPQWQATFLIIVMGDFNGFHIYIIVLHKAVAEVSKIGNL
jgi:hypothetical protein